MSNFHLISNLFFQEQKTSWIKIKAIHFILNVNQVKAIFSQHQHKEVLFITFLSYRWL